MESNAQDQFRPNATLHYKLFFARFVAYDPSIPTFVFLTTHSFPILDNLIAERSLRTAQRMSRVLRASIQMRFRVVFVAWRIIP